MNIIIAAMDQNNLIGINNQLPWHNKEDLKFFQHQTTGWPLIMGYNTWQSLKNKPLANRINIVLSRKHIDPIINEWGPYFPKNLEEAFFITKNYERKYIIGGREIYNDCLDKGLIDTILITRFEEKITIEKDDKAIYFPEFDKSNWSVVRDKKNELWIRLF